jgi:hypothetical protein
LSDRVASGALVVLLPSHFKSTDKFKVNSENAGFFKNAMLRFTQDTL